ncbi:hypothetical protein LCGC14_1212630, partial [marine sediment metagenome]
MTGRFGLLLVVGLAATSVAAGASDYDEFKIKRQQDFRFVAPPRAKWEGPRLIITFETRAFCDVTVAIERGNGRILRHLACGVLGGNAPEPLLANSKRQRLVWDGKDDAGRYLDAVSRCAVRVSLGLKATFERALFWEPKKRMSPKAPLLAARPEGVYVYEGYALDHLKLFDRKGNYLRTVYPFPADKLKRVTGLTWREYPRLGRKLPLKRGSRDETLLTSGPNGRPSDQDTSDEYKRSDSHAASALAIHGEKVALAHLSLNRLATDGSTPPPGPGQAGRMDLNGPRLEVIRTGRRALGKSVTDRFIPGDAAFSPDGKWVYLTGYHIFHGGPRQPFKRWLEHRHGVTRMAFAKGAPPQPFKGANTTDGAGTDSEHFNTPLSVACDAAGNVYVADYLNDRVQVFGPDGGHLRTVKVNKPVVV